MKISVIVPAFNEEKLIVSTLRGIRLACEAFHRRSWPVELIVCDNNSTDRTAELARAEGAAVVFEPINQIGRARNRGAASASGDWLVFIDADSRPAAALFAEVADRIQTGTVLAGGVTLRMDQARWMTSAATALWNLASRLTRWMAGSFIFCEATTFRDAGGFDTELFVAEELALSRKLKRWARARGKKLVILHRHPLVTSARKADLYSPWELLRFLCRAVLFPRRTMKNRGACLPWYDGRR